MKYAACKSEMERLEDLGQVQDLRRELQVACTTKEELGAIVQGIICESGNEKDCDANDFTSGRASYQAIKTKQTLMEENCSLVTKEKICCCSEWDPCNDSQYMDGKRGDWQERRRTVLYRL